MELKNKGFFQDVRIKKLESAMTQYLATLQNRSLSHLVLQVTQNCNLRCSYCPFTQNNEKTRSHKNINMSWEVAKQSIDYLYEHSVDSERVNISFYGGEPLYNFNLIKQSIAYFDNLFIGKHVNHSMTINATLLNKDICEFLEKYDFNLMISLDGNKETNDNNRKFAIGTNSVFEVIIKNLKMIEQNFPKLFERLFINMVLDPSKSMDGYTNLFVEHKFMNKIRVRSSEIDDLFSDDHKNMNLDYIQKDIYLQFLMLVDILEIQEINDEINILSEIKKDIIGLMNPLKERLPFREIELPSGPCIPGCNKLFVDVNGNFYACEKFSETIEDAKIGNIKTGLDVEKSKIILNGSSFIKEDCVQCFAFNDCTSCFKDFPNGPNDKTDKKIKCNTIKNGFHRNLIIRAFLEEWLKGEYKREIKYEQ